MAVFKSYESPETLEYICTDRRIETVNHTLDESQMNIEREKYYTVDREIIERQSLIAGIKARFDQNIEPGILASSISELISKNPYLTENGLKKLIKDKADLSLIIETGKRKSEEEVFVLNKKSAKKTAFYSLDGYLIEIRDSEFGDVNLFSEED
ncbi:MAG TPA: hypothetical protein VKY44_09650 [Flavobacterium sp.]|nr:hypothetical protein [Flavobacterium sp.]